MKKNIKPLLLNIMLAIGGMLLYFSSTAQETGDLRVFEMQKAFKDKTTGEIKVLQNWSKSSFLISLNLKNKEIEFIDNNNSVITWFTVLNKNVELSNEATSMATFDCLDNKKQSCKVTVSMSNKPTEYFALIMVTYTTESGFIMYIYKTRQEK